MKASEYQFAGSNLLKFKSTLSGQLREFQFDRIFKYQSRQSDICEEMRGLISSTLEGFNVCIMTYG